MRLITIPVIMMMATSAMAGEFELKEENDAFGSSDRFYTQGLDLKFGYLTTNKDNKVVRRAWGIRNLMYTPADIDIAEEQPDDRPWAGLTAAIYDEWQKVDEHYIRTEWLLGVVGEWSQSGPIQTWFHEVIDNAEPMGWDNQIPSEPFINLRMEYYKPLWIAGNSQKLSTDFTGIGGASVGTAFINADVGGMLRSGWNIPQDYRTGIIKPTNVPSGISAYLFGGATGRIVAHNVTLGGSLFQSGPKQDMEPFVYDLQGGASLGVRDMFGKGADAGLSYSLVHRSKEFDGQKEPALYGAITISVFKSF